MSYIQNNLQAGEVIKYKADIHWYIFVYPAILLLLGAFFSYRFTSVIVGTVPVDKKSSSKDGG